MRNFLDKDQQQELKKEIVNTKWHVVRTSKGVLREDIMACFFAKHQYSEYGWRTNLYKATDSHLIGRIAARLSHLCNLSNEKFNVASP